MATASTQLCAICEERHISKPAFEWCLNCQEGLCSDCSEHHKLSKASREHISYQISEYQKLTSIKHFCSEYNEKFLLYCVHHILHQYATNVLKHMKNALASCRWMRSSKLQNTPNICRGYLRC